MVCEELDESQMIEALTRWFIRRLDELEVSVEDEELSYDCNSAYDFLYFRLQADALAYADKRLGVTPTPGQLNKAFFGAEYERARRDRLARRSWVAKFNDFVVRHCRGPN
jgi:hypothetical protein